jgi:alpha-1,6-mannosyltransferase
VRIVQLANLYSPVSGGLRTAVDALGRGYLAAGHERILVVPGRSYTRRRTDTGLIVTVPGPSIAPGYRFVLDPRPVLRVLDSLGPDVVEVSDKATLAVAARWARRRGVRSVLFSHERLDAILAPHLPSRLPDRWRGEGALQRATDCWNRWLAEAFDAIVVTSAFAAAEFVRVGAPALHRVPLGADLTTFRPLPRSGSGSDRPAQEVRLITLGRLSAEKRPELALKSAVELRRRGMAVRLDMVGEGPLGPALRRAAAREGLQVEFHGHVRARADVARLLSLADVALATCPVESFGLAVLEALACGTPVVAADRGAAGELLVRGAGVAAPATGTGFADGVTEVLGWPEAWRRACARSRAEHYPWSATVAGMLAVHAGAG